MIYVEQTNHIIIKLNYIIKWRLKCIKKKEGKGPPAKLPCASATINTLGVLQSSLIFLEAAHIAIVIATRSQAAKLEVCILVPSPKFIIICCLFHLLLLLLFSSMDTKVLSSGIQYTNLPASYVRPESERPRLWEVSTCENVPVIDLGCQERDQIVQQVGDACKNYGFFQVSLLSISFFPLLLFYILIVV